MQERVKSYIESNKLCSVTDRILVAVSGGRDSVVLLHILHTLGYDVGIAHYNYQMRGEASQQDQDLVRQLAERLALPFHLATTDLKSYSSDQKLGIQEAARQLRYRWFSALMETEKYRLLATAHHQDDQIETVMLNLFRGAGLNGLQGMQPLRDHIIRPLLWATREQITAYAIAQDLTWQEDSSNEESVYRRNYIRNKLIPDIEERFPGFRPRMSENIAIWQKSARLLTGLLTEKIVLRRNGDSNHVVLDVESLEAGLKDLIVFEWLRPYGFHFSQVEKMLAVIEAGHSGLQFASRHNIVVTDRGRLVLAMKSDVGVERFTIENDTKEVVLADGRLEVKLLTKLPDAMTHDPLTVYMDVGKLEFPLVVRRWKKGDHFFPLGLGGHGQKVKKALTSARLDRLGKEQQWIMCNGEQICWVVGIRADERYKVGEDTKYILRINFHPAR